MGNKIEPNRDRDSGGKFLPGWKGGPGRKKRAEPKRDEYREMLDAKTPEILTKVIELAIDGDLTAAKIILDRVMPIQSLAVGELEEQIAELRERLECHQFQH